MNRNLCSRFAVAVLAFFLAVPAFAASPFGQPTGSLDSELLKMNRQFPGFGGLYHDEVGRPNVFLTAQGDAAILDRLGSDVQVHAADYEFSQLYDWREQMGELFARGDVAYLDIDETRNRIRVGVTSGRGSATRSFDKELARLGVPRAAVELVESEPFYERAHTVQGAFNPVPAGVEIGWSGFVCTLGFNIRFSNGGACYFITNDHCSNIQGVTEFTQYFQPFGGANIGFERFDPPFFTGGACPAGFQCKYSDSTAAVYYTASDCEFARIARTFLNSISVDHANPRWFIVGKNYAPTFTQRHYKQGRSTGLTVGPLNATCVNVQAAGTNIVRLCQNLVGTAGGPVILQGGDSGSPVFTIAPGSNLKVNIAGILWGGTAANDIYVYSPIAGVETDFGVTLPVGP